MIVVPSGVENPTKNAAKPEVGFLSGRRELWLVRDLIDFLHGDMNASKVKKN
jgi:hypothetical protein